MPMDPDVAYSQAVFRALSNDERAEWLRCALDETGASRSEVVRYLDIHEQTLTAWANRGNGLDWQQWVAVCAALRLPVTWRKPDGAHAAKLPRGRPPRVKKAAH